MSAARVVILLGSPADAEHGARIATVATDLGLDVETRVGSAHKTPGHVLDLLAAYEADSTPTVFVTVAGRSNALSGFTDAAVRAPVLACPPPGERADLWSSLSMPSGVAPGVVLDPGNAALLAAKILGLADPAVRERVRSFQKAQAERVRAADDEARRG